MREDFSRVLVESPRGGMRGVRTNTVVATQHDLRNEPDRFPAFESSSRHRGGTKYLAEHLGPLVRFLRRSLGRPWNEVYAELARHVSRSNPVQAHVFQHLWDYVAVHTEWRDGAVIEPVHGFRPNHHRRVFYVSPLTHRLEEVPPTRRKRRAPRFRPDGLQRTVDATRIERLIEGLWFEVQLARIPSGQPAVFDAVRGRVPLSHAGYETLSEVYGQRNVYGASKRALGKREIARRSLWTLVPESSPGDCDELACGKISSPPR